jgi:hypothetical protein
MKIAFITEMGFSGKISADHPNMRTEFAWMHALGADHYNLSQLEQVSGYDYIFFIFPKGKTFLSAEGSKLSDQPNPVSGLLQAPLVELLKKNNKQVFYIQEGPHWWFNDYELADQIGFYNFLSTCDAIFAHNVYDTYYYKGLFPGKPVYVMPTLMIEDSIKNIVPTFEDKAIIGGNFARWYGGFESYMVAQEFNVPIWTQTSHAMRDQENQLDNLNHLPRVFWTEWMKQLSSFKYAIHLMPTIAAGTFSLNCSYFGIPCIGNQEVDTQVYCQPDLAVDVSNVQRARALANKLANDKEFYDYCSHTAKENYNRYYTADLFKQRLFTLLDI